MSCTAPTSIPSPPTTLTSCAVPIGGSNSSILDTCCNAHVNAMLTYSAPGSASNSKADNGCFQFCITDDPEYVAGCLTNTLGEYDGSALLFECFNTGEVKKGRQEDGGQGGSYGSAGVRVGFGWVVRIGLGLGAVGAVVGSL